jgi:hypothetical protein
MGFLLSKILMICHRHLNIENSEQLDKRYIYINTINDPFCFSFICCQQSHLIFTRKSIIDTRSELISSQSYNDSLTGEPCAPVFRGNNSIQVNNPAHHLLCSTFSSHFYASRLKIQEGGYCFRSVSLCQSSAKNFNLDYNFWMVSVSLTFLCVPKDFTLWPWRWCLTYQNL